MEVKDKVRTPNSNHSIEWGGATWNTNEFSIRNRYNTEEGKFNYAGSGEVPWVDFKEMIKESLLRGHFNNAEISDILNDISVVIAKQA